MPQDYGNHRKFVPGYHYVLFLFLVVSLGLAGWMVFRYFRHGGDGVATLLLVVLTVISLLNATFLRLFPLKAQDRAILVQENLRHYMLTGTPLDGRLTPRQIVGLRFASDGEFAELAVRAAKEGLSENAIKRSITTWRPDEYRV